MIRGRSPLFMSSLLTRSICRYEKLPSFRFCRLYAMLAPSKTIVKEEEERGREEEETFRGWFACGGQASRSKRGREELDCPTWVEEKWRGRRELCLLSRDEEEEEERLEEAEGGYRGGGGEAVSLYGVFL